MRWQYKVVEAPSKMGGLLSTKKRNPEDKLNRLGRNEWELVETLEEDGGKTQAMIFKRPRGVQGSDVGNPIDGERDYQEKYDPECDKCGHKNESGTIYCEECGSLLKN